MIKVSPTVKVTFTNYAGKEVTVTCDCLDAILEFARRGYDKAAKEAVNGSVYQDVCKQMRRVCADLAHDIKGEID